MKSKLLFFTFIFLIFIPSLFMVSCGVQYQSGDNSGWNISEDKDNEIEFSTVSDQKVYENETIQVEVKVKNAYLLSLSAYSRNNYTNVSDVKLGENVSDDSRNKKYILTIEGLRAGEDEISLSIGSNWSNFKVIVLSNENRPEIVTNFNNPIIVKTYDVINYNVTINKPIKDELLFTKEKDNKYFESIDVNNSSDDKSSFTINLKVANNVTFDETAVIELSYKNAADRKLEFIINSDISKKDISNASLNLNEFNGENELATFQDILDKLNNKYKGIQLKDSDIDKTQSKIDNRKSVIVISTNSSYYTGTVEFNYTYKWLLDSAVKNKNLGVIKGDNIKDSKEDIINRINELNVGLNLKLDDFVFSLYNNYGDNYIVTLDSKKTCEIYAYSTQVFLEYVKFSNINNVVKNKDLNIIKGTEDKPTLLDILTKVSQLNNEISLPERDYYIKSITSNSATISCNESNMRYFGEFVVNYTYYKCQDLEKLVSNDRLGTITTNNSLPTLEEIVKYINLANPGINLDANEIMIGDSFYDESLAELIAKESSTKYIGSIVVFYDIENN
ncbi:hypothetical protein SCORR_v1c06140 [Spiroplasma corruscae]|uniref:Uncharacterized protein n=1 Tax=Spiroplasma corruscae TaxID=216934 RepID=A0A222EPL4_9MOLU|nr:hypothetical protein [Spiroplasma corruscae]ASP28386.1 hypothetical protein SCORR_v1c06140 [Spiroplasma corruscae]